MLKLNTGHQLKFPTYKRICSLPSTCKQALACHWLDTAETCIVDIPHAQTHVYLRTFD